MEKTFISIADPSENTTQVILPSETTVRETPKRVFVPKKVAKLGQLSLSGQKMTQYYPLKFVPGL